MLNSRGEASIAGISVVSAATPKTNFPLSFPFTHSTNLYDCGEKQSRAGRAEETKGTDLAVLYGADLVLVQQPASQTARGSNCEVGACGEGIMDEEQQQLLRPLIHNLKSSPEDAYTRSIHEILPHTFQTSLRDGWFRSIMDMGATLLGTSLAVQQPRLLHKFLLLGTKRRLLRYGKTENHKLHIFPCCDCGPVVVFVHGGAWGSGKPWMYRLVAHSIGEIIGACAVVLIEYPVYPDATILNQRDSVREALRFIRQHQRDLFNSQGNTSLVISGHSSGANICALALLEHAAEGSSFPLVDLFIGLSGVYCVKTHYLFEKSRGVHLISPMGAAADGIPSTASPTLLIEHGGLREKAALNFPATLLLHGSDDVTVPVTSSADFANALRRCGIYVQTAFPNGSGHADPLMDLMRKEPRASPTGQGIEQFWEGTKTPRSRL